MITNTNDTSRFDPFYLKEDHYSEPKEYFKKAIEYLTPKLKNPDTSLIDIGCASGDFLRYLQSEFPNNQYHGLDAFKDLLIESRKRVPSCSFHLGDMNAETLNISKSPFDVVTMLGVLSIFSKDKWIDHFCSLIKEDGEGLIFGMINPYPYDVFVRLRNQDGNDEFGWNSWSANTLTKQFAINGFQSEINYWTPPIDVHKNPENPLRSWTINTEDGKKLVTNGSRMIHDFAFLRVWRDQ